LIDMRIGFIREKEAHRRRPFQALFAEARI